MRNPGRWFFPRPHGRTKRTGSRVASRPGGLITLPAPRPTALRVYPRVCGGTGGNVVAFGAEAGLSPRVRGNLAVIENVPAAPGSIPACAGEPPPPAATWTTPRVYPRVCGGTLRPSRPSRPPRGLSPRVRGNLVPSSSHNCSTGSIPACAGEPRPWSPARAPATVYPRVCGGTPTCCATRAPATGLSPRVRGNRRRNAAAALRSGSIPACAGEPSAACGMAASCRVYPRVCGGTSTKHIADWPPMGLSPRVRGNPSPPARRGRPCGSIPACAGEPPAPRRAAKRWRVYPRVCGGTNWPPRRRHGAPGLSPRVRGNRDRLGVALLPLGSIPACAGEPRTVNHCLTEARVYPRVCGGTTTRPPPTSPVRGLSPRVRGNRRRKAPAQNRSGSIPACAGEPRTPCCIGRRRRVYPRVCGGTFLRFSIASMRAGLSPRVRGNLGSSAEVDVYGGSIPACAGEPFRQAESPGARRVYPRVCGGTMLFVRSLFDGWGLSPRVRGNRDGFRDQSAKDGSIPACAGEPGAPGARRRRQRVYPRVCGGT